MSTAAVTNNFSVLNTVSSGAAKTGNDEGSADRFLKLLVTQMQNQDPLNPMDNAQVTSQMAQINTVSGIERLNGTVASLNTQFVQMQALTGASLVGRDVTLKGDRLSVEQGVASAGFELGGTAAVKVELLSPAGRVVDTLNLGTQAAGRHDFQWTPPAGSSAEGHRFRVVATAGTSSVPSTPLMRDRVEAVSTSGGTLFIDTRSNGTVAYADIKAFN